MSTYCISDIHGNLRALKRLLCDIDFKYDGSDSLYLLGDYIDWGIESIDTLRFVMELSKYPFVTCLMGNHDYMFLGEMAATECGKVSGHSDMNWLFNNRGIATWDAYLQMPLAEREEIREWVMGLSYSAEVMVGEDWYLLGHAGPFLPEKGLSLYQESIKMEDAVWYRMRSGFCDPMANLYERFPNHIWEEKKYKTFICGHTITNHFVNYGEGEPYRIFKGEHFIDIDCGAKCMSLTPDDDRITLDFIEQHRLCALRLEDMAEFYCDRKRAGY